MPNQFTHGFGWIPDVPDIRDFSFALTPPTLATALPPTKDLRSAAWSTPFDQGQTNSCTGHSVAFLFESIHHRQTQQSFVGSPAFIYWNARVIDNSTSVDRGAYIRHAMRSVNVMGTCSQNERPLERGVLTQPDLLCFEAARDHKAVEYRRLARDLDLFRGCLVEGTPFVFGFSVYSSIENAEASGNIDMPRTDEALLGAHAVAAVGYHHASRRFLIRNSWGPWGNGGYGTIPYDYLLDGDLSDDFWTLSAVTT